MFSTWNVDSFLSIIAPHKYHSTQLSLTPAVGEGEGQMSTTSSPLYLHSHHFGRQMKESLLTCHPVHVPLVSKADQTHPLLSISGSQQILQQPAACSVAAEPCPAVPDKGAIPMRWKWSHRQQENKIQCWPGKKLNKVLSSLLQDKQDVPWHASPPGGSAPLHILPSCIYNSRAICFCIIKGIWEKNL